MSESFSPISKEDGKLIAEAEPFSISQPARVFLWILVFVGALFFLLGITSSDAKHAWTSFQVNMTFWMMIALGGSMFSAGFHICDAEWCRPVRRLFESMGYFAAVSIPLLALGFAGHGHLFAWAHEAAAGKEMWLRSDFLYIRDILALGILVSLSRRVINLSLRRDLVAIRGGLTGAKTDRWSDSCYDIYLEGWDGKDAKAELKRTTDRMWKLSPLVVFAYALVMSLIAFDQIMSVDYHWFSTLFGALYFMSGIYGAYALVSMGQAFMRDMHPLFRMKIERRTLHDLGKLTFGFGIFWAYMFWSHYLPIWYGNLHEETGWIIVRLREQPWQAFSWVTFGACFIIPFWLGLSRDVKQTPVLLFATGIIIACGLWMQSYVLFAPTIYPNEIPIGLMDLLITLGFMGGFVLCCVYFLEKAPLMPFGDLYEDRKVTPEMLEQEAIAANS